MARNFAKIYAKGNGRLRPSAADARNASFETTAEEQLPNCSAALKNAGQTSWLGPRPISMTAALIFGIFTSEEGQDIAARYKCFVA